MIYARIVVIEANIALNDTVNHVETPTFHVENTGTTNQNYVLIHTLALTAYSFSSDEPYDVLDLNHFSTVNTGSSAKITPSTLTLQPGAK
jgi:hypothetical protein